MLTDEDLTGQLKLAFDDATHGIVASPGLGAAVHRRHRAARRRVAALRIAVPAAAACAGGAVLAGGGSSPSAPGPAANRSPSVAPTTTAGSHPATRTVDYLLKVPAQASGSFSCLDPDAVQRARDSATWFVAGADCTVLVVDTDTSLPSAAQPIDLAGVPGLYGTADAATGSRTIYSRNPDASWSALTVAADTPDQSLRGFYTPSS